MKNKIPACLFSLLILLLMQGMSFAKESPSPVLEEVSEKEMQFDYMLMNYFREKSPDLTKVTVDFFRERQLVPKDMQMPLAGFFAEIFKDQKIRKNLLEEIDSLKLRSLSDFFHSVADFDIDTFYSDPGVDPGVNDMLWGSFFASGKTEYLELILSNAIKYHEEKEDLLKFLTGDSACWSLASNAGQYKEVRDFLLQSKSRGKEVIDYILNTDPDEIRLNTVFFIQEQQRKGIWQ